MYEFFEIMNNTKRVNYLNNFILFNYQRMRYIILYIFYYIKKKFILKKYPLNLI